MNQPASPRDQAALEDESTAFGKSPDAGDSPNWPIALVLLAATTLVYANRVVFTQNAVPIQRAFATDEQGYGSVEGKFGLGFAFGGLCFGLLADRVRVRWMFPAVVLVYSAFGTSSMLVDSLGALGWTRFLLGFFQAGHWPCSLRTTQRVFKPHRRAWGNSVLQAGASVGAVATPLLVGALHGIDPDLWRWSFPIVASLGVPWAIWWLATIREDDLRRPVIQTDETSAGRGVDEKLREVPLWRIFLSSRWWVLMAVTLLINTFWHYIRVWMPLTMEKDHGYDRQFVAYFTSLYYLMTLVGAIVAGWWTTHLTARGWNVHRARCTTFLLCALLASVAVPAAFAPRGIVLLVSLLFVALGSLGLFPIYYSLGQELSARYQGTLGGLLGFCAWAVLYFVHPEIGRLVKADPELRPYLLAAISLGPLLATILLAVGWGRRPT